MGTEFAQHGIADIGAHAAGDDHLADLGVAPADRAHSLPHAAAQPLGHLIQAIKNQQHPTTVQSIIERRLPGRRATLG